MTTLDPAERLATALRADPPELDDLARLRGERAVVEGASRALFAPPPPPRRRALWAGLAAGLLAAGAAAALVAFFSRSADHGPATGTDAFDAQSSAKELMEASLVAEGMPAQGETLHTGAGQRMRARIGASQVELEPNTRAEFERIAPEELRVRLHRGAVQVEFHPKLGSGQRMIVATPAARVEVVGTVFRVEVDGAGATGVWVEQGTVKVVPTASGGGARLVHAGQSTRVEQAGQVPVEVVGGPEGAEAEADAEGAAGEAGEAGPANANEEGEDREAATGQRTQAPGATGGARGASRPTHRAQRPHRAVHGRVVLPDGEPVPALARARRLLSHNRHEAARTLLRQVADDTGHDRSVRTRAWVMIAESFEEQGRYADAAEAYGKASWFGAHTRAGLHALFMLGRLREGRLGDAHGARNAYQRYLRQASDGPDATEARQGLCRLGSCY